MKQYRILNKQDVTRILMPYSIKNLTNIEKLSGGCENTNYLITANNHHYVLNLFERKSLDHVRVLAQLLSHLNENNFFVRGENLPHRLYKQNLLLFAIFDQN